MPCDIWFLGILYFIFASRMKVTQHISQAAGKTLFSFEILPPVKGKSIDSIFNVLDPLMEFKPSFIKYLSVKAMDRSTE